MKVMVKLLSWERGKGELGKGPKRQLKYRVVFVM